MSRKELVIKQIKEINTIIYEIIFTILLLFLSLIIIITEGITP